MSSLSEVLAKHRAAREIRRPFERNWWLNMAFLQNEQWVVWDRSTNGLRYKSMDLYKPRLTSNILTPRVRLQYSILTRQTPTFSLESATQSRAKEVYYLLDGFWREFNYLRTFKDALLWAICTGDGYIKPYWDPFAGPHYGNGVYGGAPIVDAVSPFELYIDPYARSLDEASWVIHERVRSREYVREKWGVEVSSEPISLMSSQIGSLRLKYNQTLTPSNLVSEYWERPNAKNRRGYYLVYSGNTQLYEGDNPYAFFETGAEPCAVPFCSIREALIPGELHGQTWVSDSRQVNVAHNKLRNDALENSVKLSNPPLIAPKTAFTGDIEMKPGTILGYNAFGLQGGKIDQLKIEPFPAQVIQMISRLEGECDQNAGLTALDWGNMPRGIRSKQQMNALEGMSDQRQQVTLDEYVAMIQSALAMVVKLSRRFMHLPREVYGGDTVYVLKGSDVPADSRIKAKVKLQTPPSDAENQAFLMALYDRHVIQDPRLLARLSRYGSFDEIFKDADLDTTQAQRENRRMLEGQPQQAEEWHNHAVHLIEHNRFRKSEEYEGLPGAIKKVFAQHCEQHQELMAKAHAQQQPQGLPGQGPPGGHPAPPGNHPGAPHPGSGPAAAKGRVLRPKPPGAAMPPTPGGGS